MARWQTDRCRAWHMCRTAVVRTGARRALDIHKRCGSATVVAVRYLHSPGSLVGYRCRQHAAAMLQRSEYSTAAKQDRASTRHMVASEAHTAACNYLQAPTRCCCWPCCRGGRLLSTTRRLGPRGSGRGGQWHAVTVQQGHEGGGGLLRGAKGGLQGGGGGGGEGLPCARPQGGRREGAGGLRVVERGGGAGSVGGDGTCHAGSCMECQAAAFCGWDTSTYGLYIPIRSRDDASHVHAVAVYTSVVASGHPQPSPSSHRAAGPGYRLSKPHALAMPRTTQRPPPGSTRTCRSAVASSSSRNPQPIQPPGTWHRGGRPLGPRGGGRRGRRSG